LTRMGGAPKAIVVAGPSGVGKGTLIEKLKAEYPEKIGFSVSHTTRDARAGEINGTHYHFAKKEDMKEGIDKGLFIEWAEVHGNYYGTSKASVESVAKDGKACVLDIDVQGCRSVRKAELPAKIIFVAPPSMEELEKRLRGRGTETEEKILKRLKNAEGEMAAREEAGLFDAVLVNDDLEETYTSFKTLVKDEIA